MRLSLAPGYCAGISYRFVRAEFSAAFVLLLGCAAGCPSPRAGSVGQGALSLPDEGSVRIVASPLESSPTRQHFKWSIIGERNWTRAKVDGGVLEVGGTYPLNSATQRGGCNIYEADLTVKTEGDAALWETRLHGSDGTTVTESGREPLGGRALADVVQIRQTEGAVKGLPADVILARISARDVRLKIDR